MIDTKNDVKNVTFKWSLEFKTFKVTSNFVLFGSNQSARICLMMPFSIIFSVSVSKSDQ